VLDLVNDLLDISKIEAGEQEMAHEAVSLNESLAEAVAMMQPQANRERVIIRSSFASRLPEVVADERSIRQIALNLLSNAVRYTQAGGQVIVSTSYENSGDVVMRVRDTGVGMSQSEIEQALKPFQADQCPEASSWRRHRTWPAADQGDGRSQSRAVFDQFDAGRRDDGRDHIPVHPCARRLTGSPAA
jgi:K+-sensing histidine kinase KdpD